MAQCCSHCGKTEKQHHGKACVDMSGLRKALAERERPPMPPDALTAAREEAKGWLRERWWPDIWIDELAALLARHTAEAVATELTDLRRTIISAKIRCHSDASIQTLKWAEELVQGRIDKVKDETNG